MIKSLAKFVITIAVCYTGLALAQGSETEVESKFSKQAQFIPFNYWYTGAVTDEQKNFIRNDLKDFIEYTNIKDVYASKNTASPVNANQLDLAQGINYRYWRVRVMNYTGAGCGISEVQMKWDGKTHFLKDYKVSSLSNFHRKYPVKNLNDTVIEAKNAENVAFVKSGNCDFYVDLKEPKRVTDLGIAPQGDKDLEAYNKVDSFAVYVSHDAKKWEIVKYFEAINQNLDFWNPGRVQFFPLNPIEQPIAANN